MNYDIRTCFTVKPYDISQLHPDDAKIVQMWYNTTQDMWSYVSKKPKLNINVIELIGMLTAMYNYAVEYLLTSDHYEKMILYAFKCTDIVEHWDYVQSFLKEDQSYDEQVQAYIDQLQPCIEHFKVNFNIQNMRNTYPTRWTRFQERSSLHVLHTIQHANHKVYK